MFRLQTDLLKLTRPVARAVLAGARQGNACAPADAPREETWNGHAQRTWIWQAQPAFLAVCSSPNSLLPQRETAYSFSAAAASGLRAWDGGELYLNPTVVQGKALSGLDGMTNGAQQQTSGTNPPLYRAGRFLQPAASNGVPSDTRIVKHDSDQVALERGYRWLGQPGKLRLPAFRNRVRVGSFRDALADAADHGGVPDVARVRKERSKIGFGMHLEQSLGARVGAFARCNDGQSETYSFTEIERALGVSVDGEDLQRAGDRLGAAMVSDGLSKDQRDYLAAGGRGACIGHGRLDCRLRQIVEAYYRVDRAQQPGLQRSLDGQHIINPAYNHTHGPVNAGSTRLHGQY